MTDTTESPSTEALIDAVGGDRPLRPLDTCHVRGCDLLALVARTRELEATIEGSKTFKAWAAMDAEVTALRAEVERLRAEERTFAALKAEVIEAVDLLEAKAERDALRTKLASTEAALGGALDAMRAALRASMDSATARVTLTTALTTSTALGARVIEEAERRGEERAERRHEADETRRQGLIDEAHEALWSGEHRGEDVGAMARRVKAERDEARRERDAARRGADMLARATGQGGSAPVLAEAEATRQRQDAEHREHAATLTAALQAAEASRDAALARVEARAKREALEEAAEAADRDGVYGAEESVVSAWLRSRAEKIG